MKTVEITIEDKVDELLGVLDNDVRNMQQSLSRLNELRSLVIKRDDAALGKLLESIQPDLDNYKANELKRCLIRKDLADAFGCEIKQMTLSTLHGRLSDPRKTHVAAKRTRLQELAKELRKEHLGTMLLLNDCARLNSALLRSVFDIGRAASITYNAGGAPKRQTETAFVDLKF